MKRRHNSEKRISKYARTAPRKYSISDHKDLIDLQKIDKFTYCRNLLDENKNIILSEETIKEIISNQSKKNVRFVELRSYVTDVYKLKEFNGKGLFAGTEFNYSDNECAYLGFYSGILSNQLPGDNQAYIWDVADEVNATNIDLNFVDGFECGDELRYANHSAKDTNLEAVFKRFTYEGKSYGIVLYKIIKSIAEDDQLIISYGKEYSHMEKKIYISPSDNECSPSENYLNKKHLYTAKKLPQSVAKILSMPTMDCFIPSVFFQENKKPTSLSELNLPILSANKKHVIDEDQPAISMLMYLCAMPFDINTFDAIKLCLQYGAGLEKQHSVTGETALMILMKNPAVSNEDKVMLIHHLLDKGASINNTAIDGGTPLHYAIKNKAAKFLRTLKGARCIDEVLELLHQPSSSNFAAILPFAVKAQSMQSFEHILSFYHQNHDCEYFSQSNIHAPSISTIFFDVIKSLSSDRLSNWVDTILANGLKGNAKLLPEFLVHLRDQLGCTITLTDSRLTAISIDYPDGAKTSFKVDKTILTASHFNSISMSPNETLAVEVTAKPKPKRKSSAKPAEELAEPLIITIEKTIAINDSESSLYEEPSQPPPSPTDDQPQSQYVLPDQVTAREVIMIDCEEEPVKYRNDVSISGSSSGLFSNSQKNYTTAYSINPEAGRAIVPQIFVNPFQLHDAVEAQRYEEVVGLINQGCDLNVLNTNNQTAFDYYIKYAEEAEIVRIMQYLIQECTPHAGNIVQSVIAAAQAKALAYSNNVQGMRYYLQLTQGLALQLRLVDYLTIDQCRDYYEFAIDNNLGNLKQEIAERIQQLKNTPVQLVSAGNASLFNSAESQNAVVDGARLRAKK